MKFISKKQAVEALQEEFGFWSEIIETLPSDVFEKEIRENFKVKDLIAHLMMWQKVTISRLEACIRKDNPNMPEWHPPIVDPERKERDLINKKILELNKGRSFPEIFSDWKRGFKKVIKLAEEIPESDYFDNHKYSWLFGYNVSDVVNGTIVHHKEDHRPDLKNFLVK